MSGVSRQRIIDIIPNPFNKQTTFISKHMYKNFGPPIKPPGPPKGPIIVIGAVCLTGVLIKTIN